MSRRRNGARTIAVLNGKGGSSKTSTTAMLAAVFARRDGEGVLAWDNNETSGTLGWRTERAPHEAHVRDLLPHVDELIRTGGGAKGISRYVHHQSIDRYDVLQSNPAVLPEDPRLTGDDFDAVHRLVSDCFRLVIIDSGNAEDALNWVRMLERVDQIVVSTTTSTQHAAAARLLLSALHSRDARSAALADEAVVIVSRADRDERPPEEVVGQFEWLARTAVTIPYDQGMRADHLLYENLAPATQQAWLRAAEAVEAAKTVGPPTKTVPPPPPPPSAPATETVDPPPSPTAAPTPTKPPPPSPAPLTAPPPPWQTQRTAAAPEPPSHTQEAAAAPSPPSSRPAAETSKAGTADAEGPADAPTPPAEDRVTEGEDAGGSWLMRHRWTAVIAAAAAVILLLAAFFAGGALLGPDPEGPFPAPSGKAPVDPVEGWTKQAAWISPSLAPASRNAPPLMTDDTIITTVESTSGTVLVALRAEDGTRLWLSPIEDPLTGPPQLVTRGDHQAIVAATAHTLIVWPDLGGAGEPPTPQTWDFTEADLKLVPGSPVPLLANEETLTARVLVNDQLELVTLPSGGRPIAADEDGTVTTISRDGHWRAQEPGEETAGATLLQPPAFGSLVDTVLGTAGDTLVVSWTHDDKRSHLAGYDTTKEMKLLWKTSVPGHPTPESFRASPDGRWAIAGRATVDLRSGSTEKLPKGWETVAITAERAWSAKDVITRKGQISPLDKAVTDAHSVPTTVTPDGLGVVVAAPEGEAPRMYALRPAGDTADA